MEDFIEATEQKTVVSSEAGAVEATTAPSTTETKSNKYGPDVMTVQLEEIARMVSDPRYHITPIPETNNAVINITEARKAGIEFYRKKDNRIHGRDMEKTGKSIMEFGAQMPLSICSVKEANAAGVKFERFPNDPKKGQPTSEGGFMVIEGHGRMEYLLGKPIDKWPLLLGVFPVPDKDGEIHIENGFIELNQNDSIWGSMDYLLIRLADPNSHQGWQFIKDLEDMGLGFTISSIFATTKENTITKRTVLNSKPEEVEELFKYLEDGMKIFNAAKDAFIVAPGSAIKTKVIPNKIFDCWRELQATTSLNASKATDYMVSFLKSIKDDGGAAVINASRKQGDKDRDTVRKEVFTNYFNEYKTKNPIV